ncbi:hypothetical protein D8674_003754 [Pyrus ussuriensis x Pyrus communis]|uniref:Uncharacterized protein n=1 Tax=Pyrus ussuriensis x Pyrus communis TaxID=2448454 RepID=A0A5N5FHY2_9ROSA|nr:hypothetical protein D8674_003754 [Pyrus ussuriensis x Pyrus communis]
MGVDIDPFPTTMVSMVDACLPRDKGKEKAEFIPMRHVPKQNCRPRLKIDLFSNEPPQDLIRPAVVKSMWSSSIEEANKLTVLCSRCKVDVILAESKEEPRRMAVSQTSIAALEYMREFHKKHSANDLYGLPKACQDTIDLILTCPNIKQIIQKTSDSGLKARHIIGTYSSDNRGKENDTPHANPEEEDLEKEEDHDSMGPSILDNMEISMEIELAMKEDKLKVSLVELFPCSSSVNLHHLKPLYVIAHIDRYPVSKIFINYGMTVNIIPVSIMKALRRFNDELIPLGITMSSFVGDKFQT